MTKHFLFDFDGTLVDSMKYWAKCMVSVLDNHAVSYDDDIISIITPLGSSGTISYFQKIGLDMPTDDIKKEINAVLTPVYQNIIPEKLGVRHCLLEMKKRGYSLHVLTASPHVWLDPCLERLRMTELFDNVWSSDDFGIGKNDSEIYRMVAQRIGARVEEITFLDDNINADKAAKLSGVKVIGVYDDSTKNDETQMRAVTDGYVYNFIELEEMVKRDAKY